jgi:hypothetical protein
MLVCVFAGMEFASFLRRNVLPSVACLAVPHFPTLPYKLQNFQKNVIEHKICVLVFSTILVRNVSYSK